MGAQTLVTTLMSEVANSYVDLAYADSYWEDDYRTAVSAQWAALTDGQKAGVLIDACEILESLRFTLPNSLRDYTYFYDRRTRSCRVVDRELKPYKQIYTQRLQFPRNLDIYVSEPPSPELMGQSYIPDPIKEAQCEQAVYLLTFDEATYANRLLGVAEESTGLGKGSITTSKVYAGSATSISMLAPRAIEKVKPFLVRGESIRRS
jgi:hypothetical protein